MRLAITTDWLVTMGGAEHVMVEMCFLYPSAPIFTTVHREGSLPFEQTRKPVILTSALQKWYKLLGDHRLLLPFMPRAVESWDLRGYDVIVSSSHAVAKGCIPPSTARHICYCHTPMRYAWEMEEQYLDDFHLRGPLRALTKWQLQKLRLWDLSTAKRVDLFIANSTTTQERIKRIYGRDSIVLHPPVDDRFFQIPLKATSYKLQATQREGGASEESEGTYYLAVGRLVPYKRFDLLVEVATREKLPLKIVGEGPDLRRLKRSPTGPTVEFLGYVPESDLPQLYRDARALIFPVEEDAGIAPLEAQACGTPVIAFGKGGVLDTVNDGVTGMFFQEQTSKALSEALQRFGTLHFDPHTLREHAKKFSSSRFRERLKELVERTVAHVPAQGSYETFRRYS